MNKLPPPASPAPLKDLEYVDVVDKIPAKQQEARENAEARKEVLAIFALIAFVVLIGVFMHYEDKAREARREQRCIDHGIGTKTDTKWHAGVCYQRGLTVWHVLELGYMP